MEQATTATKGGKDNKGESSLTPDVVSYNSLMDAYGGLGAAHGAGDDSDEGRQGQQGRILPHSGRGLLQLPHGRLRRPGCGAWSRRRQRRRAARTTRANPPSLR